MTTPALAPARWTISRVARALDLSLTGVRKLDEQLAPERTADGLRLYDPRVVAHVARLRATAAGERDARRATRGAR